MNAFVEAKVRFITDLRSVIESAIDGGYEAVKKIYKKEDRVGDDEYFDRLEVCNTCCPDGECKMCGCRYVIRVADKNFNCQLGKFNV